MRAQPISPVGTCFKTGVQKADLEQKAAPITPVLIETDEENPNLVRVREEREKAEAAFQELINRPGKFNIIA